MAVIRQQRQNVARNIGVIRADTGEAAAWRSVGQLADNMIQDTFSELKRQAKQRGIETAQAASAADLRAIDPITGNIRAFNIPDNFGTVAQEAYKSVIEDRYIAQTEQDFKTKAREFALLHRYDNDGPALFETKFGQFIESTAKNAPDRFAPAIEKIGSSLLASNKLSLLSDKIDREREETKAFTTIGTDEGARTISQLYSSLNFNDQTQFDADLTMEMKLSQIEKAENLNILNSIEAEQQRLILSRSVFTGIEQRIISRIQASNTMDSIDVVQINQVIQANGVGIEGLDESVQDDVREILNHPEFNVHKDSLKSSLTSFQSTLSREETNKRTIESDNEARIREETRDRFNTAQAGVQDIVDNSFEAITNELNQGNINSAISEYRNFESSISETESVYEAAGRSTGFLQRKKEQVRQHLISKILIGALDSLTYDESVALDAYMQTNGNTGDLKPEVKKIADQVFKIKNGLEDDVPIGTMMNSYIRDKKPTKRSALDERTLEIVSGNIVEKDALSQKSGTLIISNNFGLNEEQDPVSFLASIDRTNPEIAQQYGRGFLVLDTLVKQRGIVPDALSNLLNSVASGGSFNETVIRNSLNHYMEYSNVIGADGKFYNRLTPAIGKGIDPKADAILSTTVRLMAVRGSDDLTRILSDVIQASNNPDNVESGLQRVFSGMYPDVKMGKSKLNQFLNQNFGTNKLAHETFRPLVEVMASNNQSFDQIQNTLEATYNKIFVETEGLVVDPNSGTTNRSPYAMNAMFPNPQDKDLFMTEVQKRLNNLFPNEGYRFSEHEFGGAEKNVRLVPFPNQQFRGGSIEYVAMIVDRNNDLVPLLSAEGPLIVSTSDIAKQMSDAEKKRNENNKKSGRATPRQIAERTLESQTGKVIDPTESAEAEEYIRSRTP